MIKDKNKDKRATFSEFYINLRVIPKFMEADGNSRKAAKE